jgi:hypothetical protein
MSGQRLNSFAAMSDYLIEMTSTKHNMMLSGDLLFVYVHCYNSGTQYVGQVE